MYSGGGVTPPICILRPLGDSVHSLIAQLVKNPPAVRETWVDPRVRKVPWRRDRPPTPVFLGFPCGSAAKESACNVGDLGSIPGLERSPGEGKGHSLQYPGLEDSMDCIVHGVSKSRTRLSDFHLSCFRAFAHTVSRAQSLFTCSCMRSLLK